MGTPSLHAMNKKTDNTAIIKIDTFLMRIMVTSFGYKKKLDLVNDDMISMDIDEVIIRKKNR
jgi:16S rRNA A1518/A1519 N6-dimethyltransferase RsmA/KsgA/DIM1 with predicted DNA glycosylase/AP lyase activity